MQEACVESGFVRTESDLAELGPRRNPGTPKYGKLKEFEFRVVEAGENKETAYRFPINLGDLDQRRSRVARKDRKTLFTAITQKRFTQTLLQHTVLLIGTARRAVARDRERMKRRVRLTVRLGAIVARMKDESAVRTRHRIAVPVIDSPAPIHQIVGAIVSKQQNRTGRGGRLVWRYLFGMNQPAEARKSPRLFGYEKAAALDLKMAAGIFEPRTLAKEPVQGVDDVMAWPDVPRDYVSILVPQSGVVAGLVHGA